MDVVVVVSSGTAARSIAGRVVGEVVVVAVDRLRHLHKWWEVVVVVAAVVGRRPDLWLGGE